MLWHMRGSWDSLGCPWTKRGHLTSVVSHFLSNKDVGPGALIPVAVTAYESIVMVILD